MTPHSLSIARPAITIIANAHGRLTDKQAIAFGMRFASARLASRYVRRSLGGRVHVGGCVRILDSAPPMPALPCDLDAVPFR